MHPSPACLFRKKKKTTKNKKKDNNNNNNKTTLSQTTPAEHSFYFDSHLENYNPLLNTKTESHLENTANQHLFGSFYWTSEHFRGGIYNQRNTCTNTKQVGPDIQVGCGLPVVFLPCRQRMRVTAKDFQEGCWFPCWFKKTTYFSS